MSRTQKKEGKENTNKYIYHTEEKSNKTKKYNTREFSPTNINFVLDGKPKSDSNDKKTVINNANNYKKVICFDYIQEEPYLSISETYSIPNYMNYNLVCSSDFIKNQAIYNNNSSGQSNSNINITIPIGRVKENNNNSNINNPHSSVIIHSCDDNKKYKRQTYTYNNDNKYKSFFSLKQDHENKSYKDLIEEIFKGKEIESFAKNINIKTYNVPNDSEQITQEKTKNRVLLPNINNNNELKNIREFKDDKKIKIDNRLKIVNRNNYNNDNISKVKQMLESEKDNKILSNTNKNNNSEIMKVINSKSNNVNINNDINSNIETNAINETNKNNNQTKLIDQNQQ